MARRKLSDELKEAIAELPHKEKNKLLNRLIAKDDVLTEQLSFQLLENSATTQFRRDNIAESIQDSIISQKDSAPSQMLWLLRKLSSKINRHVRVTKDKYGEIELNLMLVQYCLRTYNERIERAWGSKIFKLREYLVKKILRVGKLSSKIHPDYLIDFEESLLEIGKVTQNNERMMDMSEELDLDMAALLNGEFP